MSRILAEYLVEYDSSQARTGKLQTNTFRKGYMKQSGLITLIEKNDKKIFFRWNPYKKDVCDVIDTTKGIISSNVIETVEDNCGRLLTITTENSIYYFKLYLTS